MSDQTLRDKIKDALSMSFDDINSKTSLSFDYNEDILRTVSDAVFGSLNINEYEQDYLSTETTIKVFNKDFMYCIWHIDDVMQQAAEMEVEITDKQARDVLSLMSNKYDATIGINWDTISCWIDHILDED